MSRFQAVAKAVAIAGCESRGCRVAFNEVPRWRYFSDADIRVIHEWPTESPGVRGVDAIYIGPEWGDTRDITDTPAGLAYQLFRDHSDE